MRLYNDKNIPEWLVASSMSEVDLRLREVIQKFKGGSKPEVIEEMRKSEPNTSPEDLNRIYDEEIAKTAEVKKADQVIITKTVEWLDKNKKKHTKTKEIIKTVPEDSKEVKEPTVPADSKVEETVQEEVVEVESGKKEDVVPTVDATKKEANSPLYVDFEGGSFTSNYTSDGQQHKGPSGSNLNAIRNFAKKNDLKIKMTEEAQKRSRNASIDQFKAKNAAMKKAELDTQAVSVPQAEKWFKEYLATLPKTIPGGDVRLHQLNLEKMYEKVEVSPDRLKNIAMEMGLVPVDSVEEVKDQSKTYIMLEGKLKVADETGSYTVEEFMNANFSKDDKGYYKYSKAEGKVGDKVYLTPEELKKWEDFAKETYEGANSKVEGKSKNSPFEDVKVNQSVLNYAKKYWKLTDKQVNSLQWYLTSKEHQDIESDKPNLVVEVSAQIPKEWNMTQEWSEEVFPLTEITVETPAKDVVVSGKSKKASEPTLLMDDEAKAFCEKYLGGIDKCDKDSYGAPKSAGVFQEGGKWIGFDNTSGDFWVEEFDSKEEAISWAKGDTEIDTGVDTKSSLEFAKGDRVKRVKDGKEGTIVNANGKDPVVEVKFDDEVEVVDATSATLVKLSEKKVAGISANFTGGSVKQLPNKHLQITVEDKSILEGINDLPELFESVRLIGNGWSFLSSNDVGGLTEAPIVGYMVDWADDGSLESAPDVWWYPQYETKDPIEELREKGSIILQWAEDAGSGEGAKDTEEPTKVQPTIPEVK